MPILSSPGNFMLQVNIEDLHRQTLDWLSTTLLWSREASFFQKLVNAYGPKFTSDDDKKRIEGLQKFISLYSTDLVENFRQLLRHHENKLATMYKERKEADAAYIEEHKNLIVELSAFNERYHKFKNELYSMIEKVM